MSRLTIEFFSKSLHRPVWFNMYIPNDPRPEENRDENPHYKRNTKTLFLLHGFSGAAENWKLDDLANQLNFAMVIPSCENSFYLDAAATGHKYATFLGVELVEYVRNTFGLAMKPEDTALLGLSMGGYGAIHTGLAYPHTFGAVGAMSSAIIVKGLPEMKPGMDNGLANYDYFVGCFGDLDKVVDSEANLEVLIDKNRKENLPVPKIYMCCGTEDFLLEANRDFHQFLLSKGVEHVYKESTGNHNPVFWNEYSQKIVKWLYEES